MNQKHWVGMAGVCLLIAALTFTFTLVLLQRAAEPQNTEISQEEPATTVGGKQESKIQEYTKMVYEYFYPEDGITKIQEEVPPYFLLGQTRDTIQSMYEDWRVLSFSDEKVVMRRTMTGKSSERYIIGEQEGYVAVFYEQEQNGVDLHHLTDKPISSLPQEDQERLRAGIPVMGDENLARILSDYES